MTPHDVESDRQAEPSTLSRIARGEEGIEDPLEILLRDTGSIVFDENLDRIPDAFRLRLL